MAARMGVIMLIGAVWISACRTSPSLGVNTPIALPNTTENSSSPVETDTPAARSSPADTAASTSPTSAATESPPDPTETPDPLVRGSEFYTDEHGAMPKYSIDLKIGPDISSYSGAATIDYTNNETVTLDRIYLRLLPNGGVSFGEGSLIANTAKLNGQPVDIALSDDSTTLEITLAEPLNPGESAQIAIDFTGHTPVDFGGPGNESGYGIFNYTDNVLTLSAWYPMLAVYDQDGWNLDLPSEIGDSVYADMANFEVNINAPSNMVIASTGVVQDKLVDGDSQKLTISSGPAREFSLVMSPDFEVESEQIDGITINSYSLPGGAAGSAAVLKTSIEAMREFIDSFGPYPYSELDLVGAPMRYAAGVEFPGMIIIASKSYADPSNPSFMITTAHEVAHQWWYNTVGNDIFDNPWMDEALTTYSSDIYLEKAHGKQNSQFLEEYWQRRYEELVASGRDDIVTNSLHYFESLNDPGVYGGVVYTKGALFFQALRAEIGDEAFFAALKEYYDLYKFKIASPEDLLDLFEKTSGKQLDEFYNTWLYSASR